MGRDEYELLAAAEAWTDAARVRWRQAQNWALISDEAATRALQRLDESRGRLLAAARNYAKAVK